MIREIHMFIDYRVTFNLVYQICTHKYMIDDRVITSRFLIIGILNTTSTNTVSRFQPHSRTKIIERAVPTNQWHVSDLLAKRRDSLNSRDSVVKRELLFCTSDPL